MAEFALCFELGCRVVQLDQSPVDQYTKAMQASHQGAHSSVGGGIQRGEECAIVLGR